MSNNSKQNMRLFTINLNRGTEPLMIEFLSSLPNKQKYLKQLVENDMIRKGLPIDDNQNRRPVRRNIRSLIHRAQFNAMDISDLEEIQAFIEKKMQGQPEERKVTQNA